MNTPRTGFATYLKIGRVSNLPTVWTNVLAGAFLSGHAADVPTLLWVMLAITLFYTGGMYLNDAFEADIDARERPNRPIPSGQISAKAVSAIGCAMLRSFTVSCFQTVAPGAGEIPSRLEHEGASLPSITVTALMSLTEMMPLGRRFWGTLTLNPAAATPRWREEEEPEVVILLRYSHPMKV